MFLCIVSVLHQNEGDPRHFPRASLSGNLSGLGKSLGRQGWISQYLPSFGAAQIQSQIINRPFIIVLRNASPSKNLTFPTLGMDVLWKYVKLWRIIPTSQDILVFNVVQHQYHQYHININVIVEKWKKSQLWRRLHFGWSLASHLQVWSKGSSSQTM